MNSGHNSSVPLTHEQALLLNEQSAQILLNNVTTSLQWLESNYFEAIRLNDAFAKTTANFHRKFLQEGCSSLIQFGRPGILSTQTGQSVQITITTTLIVLQSLYPAFPESETLQNSEYARFQEKRAKATQRENERKLEAKKLELERELERELEAETRRLETKRLEMKRQLEAKRDRADKEFQAKRKN